MFTFEKRSHGILVANSQQPPCPLVTACRQTYQTQLKVLETIVDSVIHKAKSIYFLF